MTDPVVSKIEEATDSLSSIKEEFENLFFKFINLSIDIIKKENNKGRGGVA